MQNLIKTVTNRYFKGMLDKRFNIYLTKSKINICWIRSISDATKNYSKTINCSKKDIKNLIKWMVVETGFPHANIQVEIEAPFNNQGELIKYLNKNKTKISINQLS